MYKKVALFCIIALCAAVFIQPFSALSETASEEISDLNKKIAEHQKRIKDLEKAMGVYQENIKKKQTEAVSLKNQIGVLDNRLAQTEAEIDVTREKILGAQLEIEVLQLSIADKEKVIARQKEVTAKMIQNIHANDQKNYLEIMLTNDTFADFYSQVRYLEDVYSDLGASVKKMRLVKEDLVEKKGELVERQNLYEALKKDLDNKKQTLDEQKGVKQDLLVQTRSSELQYKTLLSSLRRQYQEIEGEIRAYEAQIRKKLAEQDKIKNTPPGEVNLDWPVPSRYITATFHDPTYPYRHVFEHNAIDIRAAQGTPVRAAAAGYVGRARRCTLASCYAYVILIHTGNMSTVYGHLSSISAPDDGFVNRGDIIGYSGGTPRTVGAGPFVTGAHLHFEVRLNGIPVDPTAYLAR